MNAGAPPGRRGGCAEPSAELEALFGGFATIRDQEPHDDVAAWANAVVQLIEDELA